ncbi:hypothetical protein BGX28_008281 [Mortierella sp. GBA30]|nr:hypothetical protein BGX28_008281 [Mortierella sp. GBA30]
MHHHSTDILPDTKQSSSLQVHLSQKSLPEILGQKSQTTHNVSFGSSNQMQPPRRPTVRHLEENEGAYKLVLNDTPSTDKSAKVSNVVNKRLSIFFGDKLGSPFMFQNVNAGETSEFQEKTKIVIVAVRGYKENDVIKSDITGPWLQFQVADTEGASRGNKFYIEYKNDFSYELYSDNNVPFQAFGSNVPVFQPPTAKGSATLDGVKAMQVEV